MSSSSNGDRFAIVAEQNHVMQSLNNDHEIKNILFNHLGLRPPTGHLAGMLTISHVQKLQADYIAKSKMLDKLFELIRTSNSDSKFKNALTYSKLAENPEAMAGLLAELVLAQEKVEDMAGKYAQCQSELAAKQNDLAECNQEIEQLKNVASGYHEEL